MELPLAVERLPQRTVFRQQLARALNVLKREKPRMGLLLVVGHGVGALPLHARGRGHLAVEVAAQPRFGRAGLRRHPCGEGQTAQNEH